MFFTRTHQYDCPIPKDDFKSRLIGKHVKIHNLDFEVFEKDYELSIIPHAEQVDTITTLPITQVMFNEAGDRTKVVITSKMREMDMGVPMIIMIICTLLLVAALALYYSQIVEPLYAYLLMGASLLIFIIFWVRLERGYFDYVRKIRTYVKTKAATA